MCHQTVGLIARHLEAAGLPTVIITSARDITEAVRPPRAVFLDFPLGHTSGRPNQPALTRAIVKAAMDALSDDTPGRITDLPYHWAPTDAWKDEVMRVETAADGSTTTVDDRIERHPTPQFQSAADAAAAAATHEGQSCVICHGIDD